VEECIDGAVAAFEKQGHNISSIKAIGITNQRETTCLWDTETGEPLYNAIGKNPPELCVSLADPGI
jgi:glycerol kinase